MANWKDKLKEIDSGDLPTYKDKIKEILDFISEATGKDADIISGYLSEEFKASGTLPDQTMLYKVVVLYKEAREKNVPLKLLDDQLSDQFNVSNRRIRDFRSKWGLVVTGGQVRRPREEKYNDMKKMVTHIKESVDLLTKAIELSGRHGIPIGKSFLILKEGKFGESKVE